MGSSHGKSSTIMDQSVEGAVSSTFVAEEKEEILQTRRRKPNPRMSRGVPKGIEGELVIAGWPNWLVAVTGCCDALNGWFPRRADTFEKIDKIGQGTYSNVYKARDILLNKVVALKKVRFDNLDPESVKFMAREIVILRRLGDHPNVLKLEGVVTSKMSCSLYLVFDYMEYDLQAIQEQKGVKFSEPEIKCYMNQLLKGLDYFHSRGILHRDVKPSNLLVNKEGILKIADFGLSTFFDPEQSLPLTSRIVTLCYRPPELLLGSTCYGVGVDLWGVGCVLGELFTGKPIMPGRTEVEQLHKVFKLCGSPSDDFWRKSKFPHETIFKPIEPYRRKLQTTFYNLPAAAVGLMETLLSIEAEYRGTAALALQAEFFTTKPFACDPSSLPQCPPPSKEIDAKGKKKYWSGPLSMPSDKMQDLLREHEAMILKAVTRARLEKGSTAKGNDHDSKGNTNHSLGPSTSTSHETIGNDQISTPLPPKSTNMQGLLEEHKTRILKDAESDGLDFVEDNQYFGLLPSISKPIDVDRILRAHDQQIQESVERAKQQKKLDKAQYWYENNNENQY